MVGKLPSGRLRSVGRLGQRRLSAAVSGPQARHSHAQHRPRICRFNERIVRFQNYSEKSLRSSSTPVAGIKRKRKGLGSVWETTSEGVLRAAESNIKQASWLVFVRKRLGITRHDDDAGALEAVRFVYRSDRLSWVTPFTLPLVMAGFIISA